MDAKLSADLNVEALKKWIKSGAERAYGHEVTDVIFNVENTCVGYGMSERNEPTFMGVKIVFGKPLKEDNR